MEQNNVDRMDARGDEPDMYELLCKVVFGEASAEEAAQVEAALLQSTELQAQKAELEATVSLVRGTMGAEVALAGASPQAGALSAERMDVVLQAAAGPAAAPAPAAPAAPAGQLITGTPWHRSPVLRAAAVTLLAGGGIWLAQGRQPGSDVELGDVELGGGSRFVVADDDLEPGALGDVTNGLEEWAARGLDAGSSGTPGTNAAGAPSGGYFSETVPLPQNQGLPVEDWRTYTYRDTSVDRRGSSGSGLPSVSQNAPAMGGALSVGEKPIFELEEPSSDPFVGQVLLSGADPARPLATTDQYGRASAGQGPSAGGRGGGFYRGPGDTVPPGGSASGELTAVVRPATKPAGAGSAPQVSMSGSQVPMALPFAKTRPGEPSSSADPAYRSFSSGGLVGLNGLGYASGSGIEVGDDERYLGRGPDPIAAGRGGARPGTAVVNLDGYGSDPAARRRGAGGGGGRFERRPSTRDRHRFHEPKALSGERPRDMFFRFWGDNPFVISRRDGLSTFAADVDTASFALARRTLAEGRMPHRAQIRTEEFVNFLEPDLTCPTEDTFGIHAELSPSPFGGAANRYLLRVGVRAMDVAPEERPPLSLTFVVDTSGSMRENNRLELVKHALRLLVDQLDGRDTISIVRFSTDASVVLEPTPATSGDVIETALFGLQPDGSTNAEAGLKLGYEMAMRTLAEGTQTRVVFLSDGVANVGQTDQDRIASDVEAFSDRNVFLNTIGVGMGSHNDVFLEQLADRGEGVCDYVGDASDARRAIVDRFVGGFVTVAKDVKIQVEFDPKVVLRWRQVGYENRAVRDQDFRNDKVDAGEIGAGHQVTCLYEVEIASGGAKAERPVATARLRWKPVTAGEARPAEEATERELAFTYGKIAVPTFREASQGFRRSALAAQLAECLRDSIHTAGDPVETLGKELAQLLSEDRHKDTATVAEMTRQAIGLGLKTRPLPSLTGVDANHLDAYYDALIRSLGGAEPPKTPKEGAEEGAGEDTETARIEPREQESRIRDLLEGNRDGKAQ